MALRDMLEECDSADRQGSELTPPDGLGPDDYDVDGSITRTGRSVVFVARGSTARILGDLRRDELWKFLGCRLFHAIDCHRPPGWIGQS